MSDQAWPGDPDSTQRGNRDLDWETPRWRAPDATQAEVEHEHRLRDDPPPAERGAIDREDSVGGRRRSGKPRPPR
jgi:hypothetical protein